MLERTELKSYLKGYKQASRTLNLVYIDLITSVNSFLTRHSLSTLAVLKCKSLLIYTIYKVLNIYTFMLNNVLQVVIKNKI